MLFDPTNKPKKTKQSNQKTNKNTLFFLFNSFVSLYKINGNKKEYKIVSKLSIIKYSGTYGLLSYNLKFSTIKSNLVPRIFGRFVPLRTWNYCQKYMFIFFEGNPRVK